MLEGSGSLRDPSSDDTYTHQKQIGLVVDGVHIVASAAVPPFLQLRRRKRRKVCTE